MTDKGNYSVAGNCKFRRWFNTIWQNSLIQKPVGQPTPGAPTADPRQNIRIIRTFDRQRAGATGARKTLEPITRTGDPLSERRSPKCYRRGSNCPTRRSDSPLVFNEPDDSERQTIGCNCHHGWLSFGTAKTATAAVDRPHPVQPDPPSAFDSLSERTASGPASGRFCQFLERLDYIAAQKADQPHRLFSWNLHQKVAVLAFFGGCDKVGGQPPGEIPLCPRGFRCRLNWRPALRARPLSQPAIA
jgi:hypothetical protein